MIQTPDIERVRQYYPASDPVHGFEHVLRVTALAVHLAQLEGADLEIVRAAALLHDAKDEKGEAGEGERSNHHMASAELAARILEAHGWDDRRIQAVQHCIRAHRFRDRREPPATLEARVLFDADKLDAIGATGAARAIGYAVQAGQPIFTPPSQSFIDTGERLPGEPHSAYHEYIFKLRRLKDRMFTTTARKLAEGRQAAMEQFFDQLADEMAGRA